MRKELLGLTLLILLAVGQVLPAGGYFQARDHEAEFAVEPDDLTRDLAAAGFQRLEYIEGWQGQEGLYALLFQRQ